MKSKTIHTKPFTSCDVKNKDLVIEMLKCEEIYAKSDDGQLMYKTLLNNPRTSLHVVKLFHRYVLDKFGFDTTNESVENYRTIFATYYNSPTEPQKSINDRINNAQKIC